MEGCDFNGRRRRSGKASVKRRPMEGAGGNQKDIGGGAFQAEDAGVMTGHPARSSKEAGVSGAEWARGSVGKGVRAATRARSCRVLWAVVKTGFYCVSER